MRLFVGGERGRRVELFGRSPFGFGFFDSIEYPVVLGSCLKVNLE